MYDDYYNYFYYDPFSKKTPIKPKGLSPSEKRFLDMFNTTGTTTERIKTTKEGEEMAKETLYKVIDTEEFGKYLATDSTGKFVLEMLNGGVKLVDKTNIEEVLPYTISIQFKANEKKYGFQAEKGVFEEGDLVVYEGHYGLSMAKVVGVDTKDKSATKQFTGWKMEVAKIG